MIDPQTSSANMLRLRAEDAEDIKVIAPLLQDALVPIIDAALIDFSQQNMGHQFIMIASRFCWEKSCKNPDNLNSERVHTALILGDVKSVQYKNIDRDNKDLVLSLLTIAVDDNVVSFFFADDAIIKVEVDRLNCLLQDMADPWPTHFVPDHQIAK